MTLEKTKIALLSLAVLSGIVALQFQPADATLTTQKINENNILNLASSRSVTMWDDYQPPVQASDDFAETEMDTDVTIEVLANDFDKYGNELFVDSITQFPENGSVVINDDGTITYTPNAGFTGTDTFEYAVSNGSDSATATVTVDVFESTSANNAPVGVEDFAETEMDTDVTIDVLANDFDDDGDAIFVDSITQFPENGSVVINDDGTITYMPNEGFTGTDSFEYAVSDGTDSSTATVTVDVIEAAQSNTPPEAVDDFADTNMDIGVTIDVLANDSDADGDNLFVSGIVQVAENGEVSLNDDGTITYMPNAGFTGTDTFEYEISDGTDTATALVTINVS